LDCNFIIKNSQQALKLLTKITEDESIPKLASLECWYELRHLISRLRSYRQAVTAFFKAERNWPELFEDPDVRQIPSSKERPLILGNASQNAENIIGRMTGDTSLMDQFRKFARDLSMFELNERIKSQCNTKMNTLVHAEALLLDWVTSSSLQEGLVFFNGWKYIGSSKPTCRLCYLYFFHHPGQVKCRPSHGNLYRAWRFPEATGQAQTKARMKIYTSMINDIRDDAFSIVENKHTRPKKHDSLTYGDTSSHLSTISGGPGRDDECDSDVENIGERLRDLAF
jgi:hypothetical protein